MFNRREDFFLGSFLFSSCCNWLRDAEATTALASSALTLGPYCFYLRYWSPAPDSQGKVRVKSRVLCGGVWWPNLVEISAEPMDSL